MHRPQQVLFYQAVVATLVQGDRHLMPGVLRAGKLFEQRGSRLEENGVGQDHDAAGRVQIHAGSCQLHQVEANQSYVDHVAGHSGDADAIAHPDSPPSHQEKIGGDGKKNGLQANRQACGDEAGKSGQRAEFTDKAKNEHDAHAKADHDPPQQKELPPPAYIGDIAEGDPAPDLRKQQDDADGQRDGQHPQHNGPQNVVRFMNQDLPPLHKVGVGLVQQEDLLAKGQRGSGDLLEARRQHIELLPLRIGQGRAF